MSKLLVLAIVLLTATCAVAQVPSSNSPQPKTGTISGTVVNENGQPIQNAIVYVRAFSSIRPAQAATSDAEGKFELNGLEPLTYQVFARHSLYIPSPREEGSPNNYHIGDSVKLLMLKGGVITGTVTSRAGEPVIGLRVHVTNAVSGETINERPTDDRGVYRIYGLPSGRYVVWAGGGGAAYSVDPYDEDVPTYSPASTRDTAAEITVRAGEETANVDIRYRGEPGRTVSGTVNNASPTSTELIVNLSSASPGGTQMNVGSSQQGNRWVFVFYGIDDGDYTIVARTFAAGGEFSISQPQRISVRGSDVTGIDLSIKPLGSVSGQVVLEELKTKECGTREVPILTETLVSAWHKQDEAAKAVPNFVWNLGTPVSADAQGGVRLRNLAPSDYYFVTRFTAKSWYLQSITLTSPATKKAVDATRVWTTIKSGDQITGLKITLAEGAASLSGIVAEGETVPEKSAVYLVPAEKESGDEVLRFYAAPLNADGKIKLSNLAPGRYWLLTAPALDGGLTKLRTPDATATRAKLRREAEAAKTEIELKPCQNVTDYRLKL
jgi:Carboxypeptidase regulatory-like domain